MSVFFFEEIHKNSACVWCTCTRWLDAAETRNSFNGINAGKNQGQSVWGKSWIWGHSSPSFSLSLSHTHTKLLAALVVLAGLGIIVTRACRQFKVHDVKEQSPTMWPYPPGGLFFSNSLWCNLCSLLRKFSFWILWKIQSCTHNWIFQPHSLIKQKGKNYYMSLVKRRLLTAQILAAIFISVDLCLLFLVWIMCQLIWYTYTSVSFWYMHVINRIVLGSIYS